LGMPAMRMPYRLAGPDVARGVEVGQRVRVSVRQTDQGPVVARIEPIGMQP
jgi:membrane fusion protein, copper/silver efflux system